MSDSSTTPSSSTPSGLSGPAIGLIVVGVVLGIVFILLVSWFGWYHWRQRRRHFQLGKDDDGWIGPPPDYFDEDEFGWVRIVLGRAFVLIALWLWLHVLWLLRDRKGRRRLARRLSGAI